MSEKHIMIVEDETIIATELCMTLTELGFNSYSIASSSHEALRMLENSQPDLIFMDISIKGEMDGITLTSKINKIYDIPVVYLTGNSDETVWKRSMETHHYGFLLKPFNKAELHAVIERTFQKFNDRDKNYNEKTEW
jgi:CheY-like chemotaxis protein